MLSPVMRCRCWQWVRARARCTVHGARRTAHGVRQAAIVLHCLRCLGARSADSHCPSRPLSKPPCSTCATAWQAATLILHQWPFEFAFGFATPRDSVSVVCGVCARFSFCLIVLRRRAGAVSAGRAAPAPELPDVHVPPHALGPVQAQAPVSVRRTCARPRRRAESHARGWGARAPRARRQTPRLTTPAGPTARHAPTHSASEQATGKAPRR